MAMDGEKGLVVLSFMKDSRATIFSVDHMINKTSLLGARDSRHEHGLLHRRKVAFPL
jgi:hypothetical protein